MRLTFVVASRRQDTWGGVFPKPGIRTLALSEFQPYVVREALHELAAVDARQYSTVELGGIATEVHHVTAGLPCLVSSALAWLQRTEWADLRSLRTVRLYDDLVRPYVADELLSLESLFPHGGDDLEAKKLALVRAFEDLAPYRLFTMSHLRHCVGLDEEFQHLISAADWFVEDLWQAMGRTALVSQPAHDPWYRVFPAIQRIVFRYFLPDPVRQAHAHEDARNFYELWQKDRSAGSEQGTIFVESLWHEAARLVTVEPGMFGAELPAYARRRSETLNTSLFEDTEMRSLAVRIFESDDDLQEQLARSPGLAEEITAIIQRGALGGMQ